VSPRTAGQHRRTSTSTVAAVLGRLREVERERDQLAAQLRALIEAGPDPDATLRGWLALFRDIHAGDVDAAYQRGLVDGWAEVGREPLDVDPPRDFPDEHDRARMRELDELRYPPHGRKRFGEPRPGDYTGGPVAWPDPAGADVEAVAS
jgi:hypothetical protein